MTKEQYLQQKQNNQIDVLHAFELYQTKYKDLTLQTFNMHFITWLNVTNSKCDLYWKWMDDKYLKEKA